MSETANLDLQFVLLRGLAREARHWGEFPRLLAERFGPSCQIDCIDVPGCGQYSEMKSPLGIPDVAEFVRGKFMEIRTKQRQRGQHPAPRTYLLAISLGGMVAVQWAWQWPDDLAGMVLINTSLAGFSPIFQRLRWPSLLHFAQIYRAESPVLRELEVLRMVSNRMDLRAEVAKSWSKMAESRPTSGENVLRQLLAASRFQAPPERPAIPTLVIYSRKDRMVDSRCSRVLARKWDLETREHPNAGHDISVDDPAWLCEQVHRWAGDRQPM